MVVVVVAVDACLNYPGGRVKKFFERLMKIPISFRW